MPTIEPVPLGDIDPPVREILVSAVERGTTASSLFPQIAAYSTAHVAAIAQAFSTPMPSLLTPRLCELIRLRSALIAGCAECQAARYEDSVGDTTVACMIGGGLEELDDGERLVIHFVEKMHLDHFSITGETYQEMAEHYSTAELVEIGLLTANLLGSHRLAKTWDLLGTDEPALPYRPGEVDARATERSST